MSRPYYYITSVISFNTASYIGPGPEVSGEVLILGGAAVIDVIAAQPASGRLKAGNGITLR